MIYVLGRNHLNEGWFGPRAALDDFEDERTYLAPAGIQTSDCPTRSLSSQHVLCYTLLKL